MTELLSKGLEQIKKAVGAGTDHAEPPAAIVEDEKKGKERGPVEEVIVRRLKPLNKKIAYTSQPPESLNADQKKAIASLPILEAQSKELEELSKQVEEAELVVAARARELREAEAKRVEEQVQAKVIAAQTALATPLSHFLRLYALLHPARPEDHAGLTFAALQLPARLRDEVQATDVLRVGKMYDELLSGGAAGAAVLASLVAGPGGADEDGDHVHVLLELLASPEEPAADLAESYAPPESVAVEPAYSEADTAEPVSTSQIPTLAGSPVPSLGPNGTHEPAAHFGERGASLNFLQADELEAHPAQREAVAVPDIASLAIALEPVRTYSWADDVDDVDDALAAVHLRNALNGPTVSSGVTEQPTDGVVSDQGIADAKLGEPASVALVQEVDVAPAETAVEVPTSAEADVASAPAAQGDTKGRGRGRGPRKPSTRGRGAGPKGERGPRDNGSTLAAPADTDGFETVSSRRPSQPTRGGRGRGGAERGRGGPGARGRGGVGARQPSSAGANGHAAAPKTEVAAPAKGAPTLAPPVEPKKSIYKTQQPTGPTSTPIF